MKQAGDFFIVGFEGGLLSAELKHKLAALKPAGVILYDCNIESKAQVKKLIQDLKALLGPDLIVSVDQEGGRVQRLRKISTNLPSLRATAIASKKTGIDYASHHGSLLGQELKELGFNLVFAPCLDLNSNPRNPIIGSRSFSSKPEEVINYGIKMHDAILQAGVMPCIKHFPGHGASAEDSHLGQALVKIAKLEYLQHRSCFDELIKAGAKACMAAHIMLDIEGHYKSQVPVSLDQFFLENELRSKFDGVVFSDEITMKALARYGSYAQVAKTMLDASVNFIVWNTNLDQAIEVADELNDFSPALAQRNFLFKKECSSLKSFLENDTDFKALMLEIAKQAIDIKSPLEKKIQVNDCIVLVSDHQKLELGLIRKIFKQEPIKLSDYQSSRLKAGSQILVLGFNLWHLPQELALLENIKKNHQLIYVECEQASDHADINLNGCSELHLEVLLAQS